MRFFSFIIFYVSALFIISAQSDVAYTVDIDTVEVVSDLKRNLSGKGVRRTVIDKVELSRSSTRSLSELLLESTGIQIKSMGQGAMATASFRGTSSNHTQIMWGGISLNSPQLGNFDLSQVPVYFIDDISLTHGTESTYGSSGSLGGTINFTNSNAPIKGVRVNFISEVASNKTFTEAFQFKFTQKSLTSTTRTYYQQSENNYKYLNKVYSNDHTIERRREADYKQFGIMQELSLRLKNKDKLSLTGWLQSDDRSLPQSIIVNVTATEQSKSTSLRSILNYDRQREKYDINTSLAFFGSEMDYVRTFTDFGTDNSKNSNGSAIAAFDYTLKKIKKVRLKTNLNYRYDIVNSDNIIGNTTSRHTYSMGIIAGYNPTKYLSTDFNGALHGVDNRQFAIYSLSARVRIIDDLLVLKASNGYNHRTPTLNDLYWNPGGNPDLKDETGFSYDISLSSNSALGLFKFNSEITYYRMDVKNWIMWVPKGNGYVWEPVNFSDVVSQGMELDLKVELPTGNIKHMLLGNYNYAHSVDNSDREDGTKGKQLPYIPRNRWNLGYRLDYKENLWIHYNTSFTDTRFTSADESYSTNAYIIHNVETGYNFRFKDHRKISLSIKAENLFNAYYESTQYYPMPLRMIWCRLQVDI